MLAWPARTAVRVTAGCRWLQKSLPGTFALSRCGILIPEPLGIPLPGLCGVPTVGFQSLAGWERASGGLCTRRLVEAPRIWLVGILYLSTMTIFSIFPARSGCQARSGQSYSQQDAGTAPSPDPPQKWGLDAALLLLCWRLACLQGR